MRKDTTTAKLTKLEKDRDKKISKKRYIALPGGIKSMNTIRTDNTNYANKLCKVEHIHITIPRGEKQYFGLSHLYDGLWLGECIQGTVYHHHKKHLGCHVQADGI
jgi:hypothetical protein